MDAGGLGTMMFRRLYWITEQSAKGGTWRATGVYTSISDLVHKGIRHVGEATITGYRITLVKLDCRSDVLGTWEGPAFANLEEELEPFVRTKEFAIEEIQELRAALTGFFATSVR